MVQRQLEQLLSKPMDRKEFLTHMGYGVLLLTGVSALLKGLTNFSGTHAHSSTSIPHNRRGFGSSKFGI